MIVTLYKGTFYNGVGGVVTLAAGDCLLRRIPDDDSFDLLRAGEFYPPEPKNLPPKKVAPHS